MLKNFTFLSLIFLSMSASANSAEPLLRWGDLKQCSSYSATAETGEVQGANAKGLAQQTCQDKRAQYLETTSCSVKCSGSAAKKVCQWNLVGTKRAHRIEYRLESKEIDLGGTLLPWYINNVKDRYLQLPDRSVIVNSTGFNTGKILSADLATRTDLPTLGATDSFSPILEEVLPVKDGFFWVVDGRSSVIPKYKTEIQIYFSKEKTEFPSLIATFATKTNTELEVKHSSDQSVLAVQSCDYENDVATCSVRLLNNERQLFEHSYQWKYDLITFSRPQISIGKNQTVWKFDQSKIGIYSEAKKSEIDYPFALPIDSGKVTFAPTVLESPNEDFQIFYNNSRYDDCARDIYVLNSDGQLAKSYEVRGEPMSKKVVGKACWMGDLHAAVDSKGNPTVVTVSTQDSDVQDAKSGVLFYENGSLIKKVFVSGYIHDRAVVRKNGMVAIPVVKWRSWENKRINPRLMIFDEKGNQYFTSGILLPEPHNMNEYLFKTSNLLSLGEDRPDDLGIDFGWAYGKLEVSSAGTRYASLALSGFRIYRMCEDYSIEKK